MRIIQLRPKKNLELSQGESGESFAFDHATGVIFHLNPLGTLILARIMRSPCTLDQLVEEARSQFTIAEEVIRQDLQSFLDDVIAEGLAEWTDEPQ